MFSPLPCFATFSRSNTPRNPDARASSGVISGNPIVSIESTSISPSSRRYRLPTVTRGVIQIRTLHESPPRRTPSRSRFVNVMARVYCRNPHASHGNGQAGSSLHRFLECLNIGSHRLRGRIVRPVHLLVDIQRPLFVLQGPVQVTLGLEN